LSIRSRFDRSFFGHLKDGSFHANSIHTNRRKVVIQINSWATQPKGRLKIFIWNSSTVIFKNKYSTINGYFTFVISVWLIFIQISLLSPHRPIYAIIDKI